MGKKNKTAGKMKKKREKDQQRLLSMNEVELVKEGDLLLDNGNTRDAIKLYQMAIKALTLKSSKIPDNGLSNNAEYIGTIKSKLFIAYATRAKELKEKNMLSESKSMEKQAIESIADPSSLDSAGMAFFLKLCTPEQAFKAYNDFYIKNGASSSLERLLAEILIKHHCWKNTIVLNNDVTLKKDAIIAEPAVILMDSGEWDEASECMKSLPRSSPFAHIRLFCRAMSAFYRDSYSEMLKAISMIPADSMLIRITEILKQSTVQNSVNQGLQDSRDKRVPTNEKSHSNAKKELFGNDNKVRNIKTKVAIQKCLWRGSFDIYDKVNDIISNAKKESYNDYLQKNILEFATLLMPTHIESVVQFILETLCQLNSENQRQFLKMAEKLLKKKGKIFRIKRDAVFVVELFASELEYFQYLDQEFTTPEEQNMAKAMLIHKIASFILANGEYRLLTQTIKKQPGNAKLLGIKSENGSTAILEMIAFAVTIDPENRELYDLAIKVPVTDRESKNINEAILLSKCAAFPDDPDPYLKLASLYHSKNAYRKAEVALQKALELAPHDSRVMDQHVISLLISADKSAGKKKFNLLRQDIEKAKQFDSKHCAPLIAEKSLFYKVAETGQINGNEIEAELGTFSLSEKLKCYALLMADMEDKLGLGKPVALKPVYGVKNVREKGGSGKSGVINPDPYSIVESLFKKALTKLEELTSWDIFNLMLPLPEEWEHLFRKTDLINYFSDNSKNAIFGKLEDRDLLSLIEKFDKIKLLPLFLTELEKRTKKNKGKRVGKSDHKLDKEENNSRKSGNNSDKMVVELDRRVLEFYRITLKNIITSRYSYSEYSELISNLDSETENIIKAASKKLSLKASGRLREALELFNFEILSYFGRSPIHFFDDDFDDDDYDDDYDDDDFDDDDFESLFEEEPDETIKNPIFIPSGKGKNSSGKGGNPFGKGGNPFGKGGFNPFSSSSFDGDFDITSIPPLLIKMVANDIKKMLKTPHGRMIRKNLDMFVDELENLIDDNGLRGKSDQELKKAKKKLINSNDYRTKITIINVIYKEEAMAKFSREAKVLFIE